MSAKWNDRFITMAALVASWSKDPSTKCGAVIVRPDRTVVSVGFNGFPRKMRDNPEHYANRDEKYSRIIHAEINALLHAHQSVTGCTLYTWPLLPCNRCAVQMIQAGILNVIAPALDDELAERWGASLVLSKKYFEEAEVTWSEVI